MSEVGTPTVVEVDGKGLYISAYCAREGCTQTVRFYLDDAETAAAGGAYMAYLAHCVCGAEQAVQINTVKPVEAPA